MPVDVRMIASSVGENNKLDVTLADVNLASTKLGSASERPRSILMGIGQQMDREKPSCCDSP